MHARTQMHLHAHARTQFLFTVPTWISPPAKTKIYGNYGTTLILIFFTVILNRPFDVLDPLVVHMLLLTHEFIYNVICLPHSWYPQCDSPLPFMCPKLTDDSPL